MPFPSLHSARYGAIATIIVMSSIMLTSYVTYQAIRSAASKTADAVKSIPFKGVAAWLSEDKANVTKTIHKSLLHNRTISWRMDYLRENLNASRESLPPLNIELSDDSIKTYEHLGIPEVCRGLHDMSPIMVAVTGEDSASSDAGIARGNDLPGDLIVFIENLDRSSHWMKNCEFSLDSKGDLSNWLLKDTNKDSFFVILADGRVLRLDRNVPFSTIVSSSKISSAANRDTVADLTRFVINVY